MSHELRTPLNSILVLGEDLTDNPEGNLTPKQVEYARTIHSAGTDLLNLISDILDLSKIESGTVTIEAQQVRFSGLIDAINRTFRHEAEKKNLSFEAKVHPNVGDSFLTHSKRLQQVPKNLLSNAIKFTETGGVRLSVSKVKSGWNTGHPVLDSTAEVVAKARKHASRHGVQNVDYHVEEAKELPGEYDLVTFFDCLHDMGDPVSALGRAKEALKPGGTVMIVKPMAADSLAENLNPVGRLYYSASAMVCVPTSLAQETGMALGAQAGEKRLRALAEEAGFSSFRRATETPFNLILEARHASARRRGSLTQLPSSVKLFLGS